MTYRDGLLVSADIHFTVFEDPVELIAHELEHVIEQLDGVDLEVHVRTGMAWKREDGAFETRRATEVGKRVAREVNLPATTPAGPTRSHAPSWRPMHVVAQQQAFATAHDPPSGRVSADGRFVVLASEARLIPSDENSTSDIYVLDVATGLVTLETPGVVAGPANGSSVHPDISGDGRYIVFESTAGNLTPVELAAGIPRVFWRDRDTGVTRLLSATHRRGAGGWPEQGPGDQRRRQRGRLHVVVDEPARRCANQRWDGRVPHRPAVQRAIAHGRHAGWTSSCRPERIADHQR